MSDEIKTLLQDIAQKQDKLFDKQDKMVDAMADTSKQVAVLSTKFETVDERGCSASIEANKETDKEIKKINSKLHKMMGIGTVITGLFTALFLKLGIK